MRINTREYVIERPPDSVTFTDLTALTYTPGSAYFATDAVDVLVLPFTDASGVEVDPSQAEQEKILIRLITESPDEEALYHQALAAIESNRVWRRDISPQVNSGAVSLEGATVSNTSQAQGYIRQSGTGLRVLNEQETKLTAQNEVIIRLLLKLLNRSRPVG